LPDPLTPADCDLRDYPSMLLDVARLRDSGLASDETPEACWAAVLLWAAAWHQVPAGSIPDSDSWIAKNAGYASRGKIDKAWSKVREGALRNFRMCSDGRLYHPVVAEKALECWLDKLGRMLSSGAGNAKRWKVEFDPKPIEAQILVAKELLKVLNPNSRALSKRKTSGAHQHSESNPVGTPEPIPSGSQEKGREGEGEGNGSSAPTGAGGAPPEPPSPPPAPRVRTAADEANAKLWRDLKTLFVERHGARDFKEAGVLLGKLASKYGNDTFKTAGRELLAVVPTPGEPHTYLVSLCETAAGKRPGLNRQAALEDSNQAAAAAFAGA